MAQSWAKLSEHGPYVETDLILNIWSTAHCKHNPRGWELNKRLENSISGFIIHPSDLTPTAYLSTQIFLASSENSDIQQDGRDKPVYIRARRGKDFKRLYSWLSSYCQLVAAGERRSVFSKSVHPGRELSMLRRMVHTFVYLGNTNFGLSILPKKNSSRRGCGET